MKFLLFNVVVAAALVYLFTGDKADFHAAADRAFEVTDSLKAKAFEVIGATAAPPVGAETAPPVAAAAPGQPAPDGAPPAAGPGKPGTEAAAATPPPAAPDAAGPAPAPPPPLTPPPTPAASPPAAPRPTDARIANLPPEIARRRAEVLGETPVGATPKAGFMTPSDRRRDLMLLSEEMELFSARAINR